MYSLGNMNILLSKTFIFKSVQSLVVIYLIYKISKGEVKPNPGANNLRNIIVYVSKRLF